MSGNRGKPATDTRQPVFKGYVPREPGQSLQGGYTPTASQGSAAAPPAIVPKQPSSVQPPRTERSK